MKTIKTRASFAERSSNGHPLREAREGARPCVPNRELKALFASACALLLASCGGDRQAAEPEAPINARKTATAIAAPAAAQWSGLIPLPLVPAAASNLPDGKVLFWAGNTRFSFGPTGQTYTSVFDPVTRAATDRLVNETGHAMFCPGTSNLPDGTLLVGGGSDAGTTSIYDPQTSMWRKAANMNIPRAYHANTVLADGSVFTLGGSWAGGQGNKHGEVWNPATGWKRLSGVPVDAAVAPDPRGIYRADNHMWLFPTPNGKVLHAGPSASMNWIDTRGNGTITPAGTRGDDVYSQSGNAVMYDTGKILKAGGAPAYDYEGRPASPAAYVMDVNAGLSVRKVSPMAYGRVFSNAVVLPNGQVLVIGGQTQSKLFSDDFSVLAPELWDPVTERFTTLPPMAVGRNYHSVALLLPDARVMVGGGGLCGEGCAANHGDVQILTPNYLLNEDGSPAVRPGIRSAPVKATQGNDINVTTDSAIAAFSLVRLSSTTHTVNNDQRRISLKFTARNATDYDLAIPSNPGVLIPGYYMLFALDASGVPSLAKTIQITGEGAPVLVNPDTQTTTVGVASQLALSATSPSGALQYAATGLPPGLTLNPSTGLISGTATVPGQYAVTLSAKNATATSSTNVLWNVNQADALVSYVMLEALSEVNGNPWASMAEFNVLDGSGALIPRTGWTVSASSEEATTGAAINAVDGSAATGWQTQTTGTPPAQPHRFVVNLGAATTVGGFKYLPRADGSLDGVISAWRFYTSKDGTNWALAGQGDVKDFDAVTGEKTFYTNNLAQGKATLQSSNDSALPATAAPMAADGVIRTGFTQTASPPNPNEWWQVDLGSSQALNAIRLWNRRDCCGERLSNFHVLVSDTDMNGRSLATLLADPAVWKNYVLPAVTDQLTLAANTSGRYVRVQLAGTEVLSLAEVQVFGRVTNNRSPVLATIGNPTSVVGLNLSVPISAADPDGDAVTFSAFNLPPGLTINTASGVVSGVPTATGVYNVTVRASDGKGGVSSTVLAWTVIEAPLVVAPVSAPPLASGAEAAFTVATNGGVGLTYNWDFGDGTAWQSTTPTANHVYAAPGLYTVRVTVSGPNGVTGVRSFIQAVYAATTALRATQSSNMALETRASAPARVWLVNQDNDTVSVFDATTLAKLGEPAVAASPRSVAVAPDGRIWVVNSRSSSVSVLSPTTLALAQYINLPGASKPYGLAFAPDGSAAYVVLEGLGQVLKLHPTTGATLATATVGANPRHVSVSADSAQLLVSRFISPPLPGENTALVQTDVSGAKRGGEVLVLNAATLAVQQTVVLQHSEKADSTVQGRGIPNYLAATVISPDGRSAWVPSKQDNIKRGTLRDGNNLDFQNTVRAITSRIDLGSLGEDYAARIDHDNSSLASAAAFHPTGAYLFVALQTSRHIAVVDPVRKAELFRVDAGRAPDGLVVSADGTRLYVNNFMDRTLGVYDLTRLVNYGDAYLPLLANVTAVSAERLPAQTLLGKQLFYDARDTRLARDSYMSCASCHNDGGQDGRVWDLTGMGEGLRNTIALRGRASEHGALHWSGNFDEVQDFEGQIRTLSGGSGLMRDADFNAGTRSQPLGDTKARFSTDLDALAAYVGSLDTFDPSPYRNADRSLTADAVAGKALFATACASCHAGTAFTDSGLNNLRDVGTLKAASGKRLNAVLKGIDTPTLRDAWATAPYLHDGSAATLYDAIRAHDSVTLTVPQVTQVASFVQQIGVEETTAESWQRCAADGQTCAFSGKRVVRYGVSGAWRMKDVVDGTICNGTAFGDPGAGPAKVCEVNPAAAWEPCANEGGTCAFTGTRTVRFGGNGVWSTKVLTGGTPCTNVVFGDPARGFGKNCAIKVAAPTLTNTAAGKLALQTSTYSSTPAPTAALAIDGVVKTQPTYLGANTQTSGSTANEWWQVDLGKVSPIDAVRLWNRTDCCNGQLSNFYLLVSNTEMVGRSLDQLLADTTVWRLFVPGAVGIDQAISAPTAGRYVRVQLAGAGSLALKEVEVMAPLLTNNVARQGAATQSSTYTADGLPHNAGLALDGDRYGGGPSVTHTQKSAANDWWQVDLYAPTVLYEARIWNRTDCCFDRLSNFYVLVSASDMTGRTLTDLLADPSIWRYQNTGVAGAYTSVPIPAVTGRFMRIQLAGSNFLSLAEVELMTRGVQTPTPELKNIARQGVASQSSTYTADNLPHGASVALDGNRSGGSNAVTHTLRTTANDWWQVDLLVPNVLYEARLWNRTDCCFDRLSNFYVFVSSTDMTGRSLADLLADPAIWRSQYAGVAGAFTSLPIPAVAGRFVRVQLAGTNFLSLAEVELLTR